MKNYFILFLGILFLLCISVFQSHGADHYSVLLNAAADPVLFWHTFMGGSTDDNANGIAYDGNGNVYVTGYSESSWGTPINPHSGSTDAFVAKINSQGNLLWHTFINSGANTRAFGIAFDSSGYVYITGSGGFVAKLSTVGSQVWVNSYSAAQCTGITYDSSGNLYIIGYSSSSWGTPISPHSGGGYDACIFKLDSRGTLIWNTFLGGGSVDYGNAITGDGSGNIFVAGRSDATWGSPVSPFLGLCAAFVAALDSNGNLGWNTFLGASGWVSVYAWSITRDSSGVLYLSGDSSTTWGAPVNPHSGGFGNYNAFVAALNSSDASLIWNTFLGGSNRVEGRGIALDSGGNVHVAGISYCSWGAPFYPYNPGGADGFAAKLDASGNRLWNTFFGGTGYDYGHAVVADGNENPFIAGWSTSSWGAPLNPYTGNWEALVVRIVTPKIEVKSPNGGEKWTVGTMENITWDAEAVSGKVRLILLRDGVAQGLIANKLEPGLGSLAWKVGYLKDGTVVPIGPGYTVKVKEIGSSIFDDSDSSFTIVGPSITVNSPNGGENWGIGSTQNITWNAPGVTGLLKIALFKDGSPIGVIAKNVDPASQSFPWMVGSYLGGTALVGPGYAIKIKEIGGSPSDTSDSSFSIVTPVLTAISPNGGENWQMGSTQSITWTASGLSQNLYIVLQQNGINVALIAKNINPDLGSYSWNVGDCRKGAVSLGTNYKVVLKESNSTLKDKSDGVFTISE